jgi:hypothetical protein
VLAGFPVAPGGGGDPEMAGGKGDVEVMAQTPVPEPPFTAGHRPWAGTFSQ